MNQIEIDISQPINLWRESVHESLISYKKNRISFLAGAPTISYIWWIILI
jgi:hypothetical protein